MAESTIGLYKTELIRRHGPWRHPDDVELATLSYVDWFNQRRLHSTILDVPPAEYETIWAALAAFAARPTGNQLPECVLSPAIDPGDTEDPATESVFVPHGAGQLLIPEGVGGR